MPRLGPDVAVMHLLEMCRTVDGDKYEAIDNPKVFESSSLAVAVASMFRFGSLSSVL